MFFVFKKRQHVEVRSQSVSYRITAFLNGEPILGGNGFTSIEWGGYPLKKGTNEIRLKAELFEKRENTIPFFGALVGLIETRELIADIGERFGTNTVLEKSYQFNVASPASGENDDCESTHILSEAQTNLLKAAAIKMAAILGSRNLKQMKDTLKMDAEAIQPLYPKWYFDTHVPCETIIIAQPGDVDIVAGDKFVMAIPSLAFLRANPESAITDVKLVTTHYRLQTQCLIFCRRQNQWALLLREGKPLALPASIITE
jgi:hypothetical protein